MAIAHELTAHLTRIADLSTAQLIGHTANFAFWADEVAHCLTVIDSYPVRFASLRAAERNHLLHQPLPDFRAGEPFIPPRVCAAPGPIPDELRGYIRDELCRAFAKFSIACYRRARLDPHTIREQCHRLAIGIAHSDIPPAD